MARKRKPPRLWLRERKGRDAVWVILDGTREIGTKCSADDHKGASDALTRYCADKYEAPTTKQGNQLFVAEVLAHYAKQRMPFVERPDAIAQSLPPLLAFWESKTIADIKGQTCRDYVAWRLEYSAVREATARHDLKNLRAAVRFYHAEHGLDAVPVITMPDASPPRERWLDRNEVARLIWAAWRHPKGRHVARFILIGWYTGTRSTAILKLRWVPSTDGGWFDLEAERLYRKGIAKRETKKRQPPAKIHFRLLPHLRRWKKSDDQRGISHVITFKGQPVQKLRRSWPEICRRAGLDGEDVVRHTLRHSAATWLMQAGVPIWEAAGYLGMSVETLERVYGHHHPEFQDTAASAQAPRAPKSEPKLKIITGGKGK